MAKISGKYAIGRSTKKLIRELGSTLTDKIVVIHHQDIDEVAAGELIAAKVKAVVNGAPVMTGRYPLNGPLHLLQAGIPIFEINEQDFARLEEHAGVQMGINISDKTIQAGDVCLSIVEFTHQRWRTLSRMADQNRSVELSYFIDNTLQYAYKEKHFVTNTLRFPTIQTEIAGRPVVVVVRGHGYQADLAAIKDYIKDINPVLIAVDGGADALLEEGYAPDLIIGDMDSISDHALRCGAELLVHAYPDGYAPGWARIQHLHLTARKVPSPGTSEDVAMLLAYEKGAEWIVTIGSHTNMLDFLEKGRKGMASTMLVRMKIGDRLIDAKGISQLSASRRRNNLWMLPVAGLFPLFAFMWIHPDMKHLLSLVWTFVKFSFEN